MTFNFCTWLPGYHVFWYLIITLGCRCPDYLLPRMNLFYLSSIYLFTTFINYHSVEEVVAHRLHQGEDAEARGDVSHQGAGSLQGLCLLWLDFTQERLQEGVTSLNLVC